MTRSETILDTTRRLEWEVTKEAFESCIASKYINSGKYDVEIGDQSSKWVLYLKRGSRSLSLSRSLPPDMIFIVLSYLDGNVKVEVEDIGIKSENDYWPCEHLTFVHNSIPMSKIVHLNDHTSTKDCHTQAGDEETFLKKFSNNKITVVAVIRFYVHRTEYIKKYQREQNFLSSLRSISDLDALVDFTIVCEGREFKCHRNILASMSSVFKAMILNPRFVENNVNSVTIEDSTPEIVEAMLEFISQGVVPCHIEEKAIDLIALADKYDLQDLIKICESSLADNIAVDNVIQTLIAIDLHVPNSQHRQNIVDFIKAEGEEVVKSRDWNKFIEKYPNLVTEIFLSLVREPRSAAGN